MIDYSQILSINYPNSEWGITDNYYNTLEWYSETPKPTQAELDALFNQRFEKQAVKAFQLKKSIFCALHHRLLKMSSVFKCRPFICFSINICLLVNLGSETSQLKLI